MRKVLAVRFAAAIVAAGVVAFTCNFGQASDSWGSWGGSVGGSSGGRYFGGSSGGWSSNGSSGGRIGHFNGTGPVRNLLGRIHSHFHGGSSGGWGSSGGGWASSGGSSGRYLVSYGSSGGWGSSGGSRGSMIYSAPALGSPYYYDSGVVAPDNGTLNPGAIEPQPNQAVPGQGENPPQPQPSGDGNTHLFLNSTETVLNINLPAESVVYVNGKKTKSTGAKRTYVARKLVPGKVYTFQVKAVLNRDGQELTRSEYVSVMGGNTKSLAIDFDSAQPVITTLAIHVPEDAKVVLAGNETNRSGESRIFSTTDLAPGEKWSGYRIVAKIERNGKTITREKTLDIAAGESHDIAFDFSDEVRVATR